MPKSIPRVMTRSQSNVSMMSTTQRSSINNSSINTNKLEQICEQPEDYFSGAFGAGEMVSKFGGKVMRGGVGGAGTKTKNYTVSAKANKRRAQKYNRDMQREEEFRQQELLAAEERRYAPVDKKDRRHQEKMAKKALKKRS